jgi:glycosyltransferase involved in cell wall biosynthesis
LNPNALKIALVADHFLPRVGGIELHVADLARQLAARGQQVHVISTTPASCSRSAAAPPDLPGVRVHRLSGPLLPHFQILYRSRPLAELRALLGIERFDVVHCHSSIVSPLSYGATYVARELRIPSVLTAHSLLGPHTPLFRLVHSLLPLTGWCTRLTGVSHATADVLARLSGRTDVGILANGIDASRWLVEPRAHAGLRVTSVMRLNIKKRPHDLVAVIPRVLKQLPEEKRPRFTIIGDGPFRGRLERQIRRLDIADHVELRGTLPRDAIKEVFTETDLFVLPTIVEAFGIAVLEARAAGLPVVARDRCGVADVIEHGRQGLLAGTRRQLGDHLIALLQDEPRRTQMAAAAREGLERFGWDAVVDRHLEEYRRAAELLPTHAGEKIPA